MTWNPSTIWAALALPLTPVGDIPFVGPDGVSIQTDAANFFFSQNGISYTGSQQAMQLTVSGGIRENYIDSTNIVSVAITANAPAGRVNMPAGSSQVTITNSYAFLTSLIFLQLEEIDATMTRAITVPFNGSFEIVGNAAATGTRVIAWHIINVKAPS